MTVPVVKDGPLTATDALDLIDHFVDSYGKDHWAARLYLANGEPHCLIGRILSLAGVSNLKLRSYGSFRLRELYLTRQVSSDLLTLGALHVLHAAQLAQDKGTWGQAQEAAHKAAEVFLDRMEPVLPVSVRTEDEKVLVGT
jgi:hypothetical protein